jgi:hypothetical protein
MSPTGTTAPSLAQAISDVEGAQTTLTNAVSSQQAAQAKYDAAVAGKQTADQTEGDAATAFNGMLDELIAAATAAKVPASPPATPAS